MPYDEVMHKFKHGKLHSGSKTGKKVTNRKQALAIMISERNKAKDGKSEYKTHSHGLDVAPSKKTRSKFGI